MDKISDLVVNEEYFICFVRDARFAKKCKLLAIINENTEFPDNKKTELYIESKRGKNIVFCSEIGIGKSKIDARNNYGKFNYEENPNFSSSFEFEKRKKNHHLK